MRTMLVAVLVVALAATTALGQVGTPETKQGTQDTCARNNVAAPGSCAQFPPESARANSPLVVYIDTGRADGRPGVWQETNTWTGLQKIKFYDGPTEFPADLELL